MTTGDEILALYRSIYTAMVERDIATLEQLLSEDFTLTHMTGTLQTGSEWLDDIASGRMVYRGATPVF